MPRFYKLIFDMTMTEIKSIIEPYGVLDDFCRDSVPLVHI